MTIQLLILKLAKSSKEDALILQTQFNHVHHDHHKRTELMDYLSRHPSDSYMALPQYPEFKEIQRMMVFAYSS